MKSVLEIVVNNIAYQYLDEIKARSTFRQIIIFIRDLFFIEKSLLQLSVDKEIVLMADTDAAGIFDYINTICLHSTLQVSTITINKKQGWYHGLYWRFILWFVYHIAPTFIFYWKLWLDYEQYPLPLIRVLIMRYLLRNGGEFAKLFNGKRCIVFYEKSILSMIGYLYGKNFEVIQHGNPTNTYWPSLAEIYYAWSVGYRELIMKNFSGEVRISGYPGEARAPIKLKEAKFDILFLSQYGSSPELVDDCRKVKDYINILSKQGYRIIVKPHPRERKDKLEFANEVVIAGKNESMEELFTISTAVCSYYSTALFLAARSECSVFRVIVGTKLIEEDFPFLRAIPAITTTDTSASPLTIAKKVKTDILDFDRYVFE